MRLKFVNAIAFFAVFAFVAEANAQILRIENATIPRTQIEVGQQIDIIITGAAANAPVTFRLNVNGGGWTGPHPALPGGMTDGSGNFTLTTGMMTGFDVATYEEEWFVNGSQIFPTNPSAINYPLAPSLPTFTVYNNAGGMCAPRSLAATSCGSTFNKWMWHPLIYFSNQTTLSSGDVDAAFADWASSQSRISFSNNNTNREDIRVSNGNLGAGLLGGITVYAQDCNTPCLNRRIVATDPCLGNACITNGWVYYAEIFLDDGDIAAAATDWSASGATTASVANNVLRHEIAHSLRIGHPTGPFVGKCSEAQDITAPIELRVFCGVSGPTTCNTNVIQNTIYPAAPSNCGTRALYCDLGTSC
jgi:hypothetical protein